jgi:hypothetical protein
LPCTWAAPDPCGPGLYCDAPGCAQGTCVPSGLPEESKKGPVCGCNGVTYWNASVAANHGMAVAADGECPGWSCHTAFPAGPIIECPAGAVCVTPYCPIVDGWWGSCWVGPVTCPSGEPKKWRSCETGSCATECEVVQTGWWWEVDAGCP